MMTDELPTASHGLAVISSKAWNAVVRALQKSWVKPGNGVRVDRSPNGTRVSTGAIPRGDYYWQVTRADGGVNIYGGTEAEWDYYELGVGYPNAGAVIYSAENFPDLYVDATLFQSGNNYLAGADEEGFICLKMELDWTVTTAPVVYALTVVWNAGAVPAQTLTDRYYPIAGISAAGEIHQLVKGQLTIEQINHGFASEFVRSEVPLYWNSSGWDFFIKSDNPITHWLNG